MEDSAYRKWFTESLEGIQALATLFHKDCPNISRIAVARDKVGDAPFLALYYENEDGTKVVNHNVEDLVINGVTLPMKIYPRDNPSGVIAARLPDESRRVAPEEAARINKVIQDQTSGLFDQCNVSCVTGTANGILIYVFHKGVLLNTDEPLPESIDGIPIIVREGEVSLQ